MLELFIADHSLLALSSALIVPVLPFGMTTQCLLFLNHQLVWISMTCRMETITTITGHGRNGFRKIHACVGNRQRSHSNSTNLIAHPRRNPPTPLFSSNSHAIFLQPFQTLQLDLQPSFPIPSQALGPDAQTPLISPDDRHHPTSTTSLYLPSTASFRGDRCGTRERGGVCCEV
jgi:hypothetical protein